MQMPGGLHKPTRDSNGGHSGQSGRSGSTLAVSPPQIHEGYCCISVGHDPGVNITLRPEVAGSPSDSLEPLQMMEDYLAESGTAVGTAIAADTAEENQWETV